MRSWKSNSACFQNYQIFTRLTKKIKTCHFSKFVYFSCRRTFRARLRRAFQVACLGSRSPLQRPRSRLQPEQELPAGSGSWRRRSQVLWHQKSGESRQDDRGDSYSLDLAGSDSIKIIGLIFRLNSTLFTTSFFWHLVVMVRFIFIQSHPFLLNHSDQWSRKNRRRRLTMASS